MGRGNAHLLEENVGKIFVIVLAGVNQDGLDLRMALHLVHERRDFWEIGTRTDNIQYFEAGAHKIFVFYTQTQYSIRELTVRRGQFAVRAKKTLVRCKGVRISPKPE